MSVIAVVSTVLPVAGQVTRIDTLQYPDIDLPKRNVQTYNTDYLYTIGLKVYSYEQFLPILDQPDNDTYYSTYFNGLMLGFNSNQMTYRLQAALFRKDNFGNISCKDCEGTTGEFRNTALKLGFQYNVNYLRVQPYLGADLGVILQRYQAGYAPFEESTTLSDRKISPVISPFIGVRAFIIPRLSVAAEANFNLAHTSQKISGGIDGDKTNHVWNSFFSPVAGITLQYHFGSLTY